MTTVNKTVKKHTVGEVHPNGNGYGLNIKKVSLIGEELRLLQPLQPLKPLKPRRPFLKRRRISRERRSSSSTRLPTILRKKNVRNIGNLVKFLTFMREVLGITLWGELVLVR